MVKLKRIYQVFNEEGWHGIHVRILYKILRRLRPKLTKSAYGIKLNANWEDATFASYFLGNYGYFFSNFLSQLNHKFVFLDIGANQGLYTILAFKNPYCQAVYAFEPISKIVDLLRANIIINVATHFETNVFVHPVAISNVEGEREVILNKTHSGATSLNTRFNKHKKGEKVKIKTISAHNLDNIIVEKSEDIIIKIDVEGHEETVFNELIKCSFFPKVTHIFYECDENWHSPETLTKILKNNGFSYFKKIGEGSHYDVLASKQYNE